MLKRLEAQSPDALLALIKLHAADERTDKVDLGVGVYRSGQGATPVFAAIKQAEQVLVDTQESKSYLGPEGDTGFVNALMPYIFGQNATMGGRISGMQTPGGTGAVRLALALAQKAGMTRVHMGTPSWPNHKQIIDDLGLELVPFDHAQPDGTANLDAVLAAISGSQPGDGILIHGCCHNPTGIDYSLDDWAAIGDAVAETGIFPIIDTAYQGLGDGLEEDAAGFRSLLAKVPEAFIAYSCDKNFGMYRDRVGAFYILAGEGDAETLETAFSNANALARASWSMPPDHGAAVVNIILSDDALRAQWEGEVADMRTRISGMRRLLHDALADKAPGRDFSHLVRARGMFCFLGVTPEQLARLKQEHAVYMVDSSRINVAGINDDNVEHLATSIAAVLD